MFCRNLGDKKAEGNVDGGGGLACAISEEDLRVFQRLSGPSVCYLELRICGNEILCCVLGQWMLVIWGQRISCD